MQDEKELNRQLKLLKVLRGLEEFRVWRDLVAKPIIDGLEAEINSKDADSMPEVILRAKIKHLATMKELFYNIFDKLEE